MSFIFGEGTPWTYDQVQRKRAVAQQLSGSIGAPRNVGEGLSAIGRALAVRGIEKRADRREGELKAKADEEWSNVFSSIGGADSTGGAGSAMGAPVTPVSTSNIEGQDVASDTMEMLVRQGLIERGLPEHVADGFVQNFRDESGLNPGINEANPIVPGSRGGFGLAQWTGPRRKALESFASERGKPVSDVNTQLDFLMTELQGPEAKAAQSILSAPDSGSAATAIVNNFLRPAEEHRARRVAQYGGSQSGGGRASPQGQESLQAIAAALSNPYIANDPGKSAILNAMLGQALAPPETMTPYQQAQLDMRQREMEMRAAGKWGNGTNVTVNNGGDPVKPLGTKGDILIKDPESPSGYRVEQAEGSSAAREAKAADNASEEAQAKAKDTITLIQSVLNDPALDSVVGNVQGRLPPGIPGVTGGQAGTDVSVKMRQIGGKAFLEAFEGLKGGGQITEREGQAAKDAMARLETAQSEKAYREALSELQSIAERGLRRASGEAVADDYGSDGGWQDVGGVKIRVKK